MTQLRSHPSPAARRTAAPALRLALAALLATGCSDENVTGPGIAAEPPPHDDMRLVNMVFTDPDGGKTRHHFMYDAAGRLDRVDFYVSRARGTPPDWLTRYTEHTWAGGVLTETNHFRLSGTGEYANWMRVNYTYDRLGYLVGEMLQRARISNDPVEQMKVDTFTTTYRYDRQGRLAEVLESSGDREVFRYDDSGNLAMTEHRPRDAQIQRHTFAYGGGRNPFYRRVAHIQSVLFPIFFHPLLLSPAPVARQENRVDPDPTLVSSLTQEFRFDDAGRPLHIRQRFVNDIHPESRGTVFLYDFEYEPATGG